MVLLTGCGGASPTGTGASVTAPPPVATVTVPPDGLLLASLGLVNGPLDSFSLPRTTVLSSVVDQPNSVSLVIAQPAASEVYAYLQHALPAAGYTVTAQAPEAETMTFTGRGWRGSFTGDPSVCAVLLRPG